VPAAEVHRAFFGPGTRDAVLACQREHGLACSGEVDESTAALLSGTPPPPAGRIARPDAPAPHEVTRMTQALSPVVQGAFVSPTWPGEAPINPSQYTVTGQVRHSDNSPFDGQVIVFEEHPDDPVRLAEGDTDPEGRYRIGYTLPENAGVARLRVAAFDHDGQRRAEETADGSQSFAMVNLRVREPGHFRVGGRVVGEARTDVGGRRVVVVDKNVGGDCPNGEQQPREDHKSQTAHRKFPKTGENHGVKMTTGGVKLYHMPAASAELRTLTFQATTNHWTCAVASQTANDAS